MARKTTKKPDIDMAAMALFAAKGFAATTIKDIAHKAGVTEGALYRHYPSKEALARELFEKELANIVVWLLSAFNGETRPVAKLHAVITNLYGIYQNQPWPLLFVILHFQSLKGNTVQFQQKSLYDYIIKYSQDLLPDPLSDNMRELLPTVLNGMLVQPIIYHHHGKLPRHPLAYVDEVVANFCKLLNLEE